MVKESLKLVVFTMATASEAYEYGIPINQVYEITRPGKTIKLPGAPAFLEGVMNLRESIIPIIDLKKCCALGTTIPKDTTRIIIVQTNEQKCGVLVDDVLEIIPIAPENMEDVPSVAGGIKSNYLLGIGKADDRLIITLDMTKILPEREERELEMVI